jgi:DNA uptake protein ComE-like DNA-binding protein
LFAASEPQGWAALGTFRVVNQAPKGESTVTMSPRQIPIGLLLVPCFALCLLAGCNQNAQDERERQAKTRDEVAKATERAKPVIEEAGRKLDNAAREAAQDVKAAAEGAKEGWRNGPHALIDINSAGENDLASLPGISRGEARRIIVARPYRTADDLVSKGVLSNSEYEKIRDRVTAR